MRAEELPLARGLMRPTSHSACPQWCLKSDLNRQCDKRDGFTIRRPSQTGHLRRGVAARTRTETERILSALTLHWSTTTLVPLLGFEPRLDAAWVRCFYR